MAGMTGNRLLALILLLTWAAAPVLADSDGHDAYDRVSLGAQAEDEVENDLLSAVLYSQREGEDASHLATEVNKAVEWAVAEASKVPQVQVQTLEYRTDPVYDRQTLKGWRVTQSLRLRSADTARLSDLVGRLQQRLAVENITHELSPQARERAEDALIRQALDAFTRRAKLITEQLGRPGFRLVDMNVQTSADVPRPMMRGMAMARMAESAPTLEPGTRTVRVQANGTIELQVQ